MADDACTLSTDEMQEEMDYSGAVWTHTYYGRGFRPSNAEMIANIRAAFNFAKAFGGEIYFVVDEDAGFAAKDAPGDPEGRIMDHPVCIGFDQPIEDERMAFLVYWENYGFASDLPEDYLLRDEIAEIVDIDPRHLTEPQ